MTSATTRSRTLSSTPAGREVGDDDLGADPGELDREAPGAGADVEDAVARLDEPAQVVRVHVEVRGSHPDLLEARPFRLGVVVEEGGCAFRVVPQDERSLAVTLSPQIRHRHVRRSGIA